jgi:hypothetical protein
MLLMNDQVCNLPLTVTVRYMSVHRDQRFQAVYERYLQLFESVGLVSVTSPFMHFVSTGMPSKYGSWGLQVRCSEVHFTESSRQGKRHFSF